jgi:choline-glycine betaine transporter
VIVTNLTERSQSFDTDMSKRLRTQTHKIHTHVQSFRTISITMSQPFPFVRSMTCCSTFQASHSVERDNSSGHVCSCASERERERQRDRETERQRDRKRERERQRDRETERRKERERERKRERETISVYIKMYGPALC